MRTLYILSMTMASFLAGLVVSELIGSRFVAPSSAVAEDPLSAASRADQPTHTDN
jgi:hypothetical protein